MVVVMVVRQIRMRPTAVAVAELGNGQRTEIEWLLVRGSGCGGRDIARRPSAGQETAGYPVMLLQDHCGGRGRCRRRGFVRRRRVVIVVVLTAVVVVVVVVQVVVKLVQIPVELESGRCRVELVVERDLCVFVVDPVAVLGAGGRGQPEPFSAGYNG